MNYNEQKTVIDLSESVSISDLGIKITNVLESNNSSNKEIHLNLGNIDLKQSQLLSIKALIEAMKSKLAGIQTTSEMTEASAIGLGVPVGKPVTNPVAQEAPSFSEAFKTNVKEDYVSEGDLNSFAQLKQMNSVEDFVNDTPTLAETQAESPREEMDTPIQNQEESHTDEAVSSTANETEGFNIYEQLNKASEPATEEDIQSALDVTFGARPEQALENIKEEQTTEDNSEQEDVFAPIKRQEKLEEHEVTEMTERVDDGKYILLDTEGITPEGVELIKANTSDLDTLYLTQTLRSGQTVSYEGNIFLIGDSHPGSEINATGDITVWGILGGIVHAGSKGNTDAKVRALKLNPIQLRIANLYSRRNDTVNVPYVQKSNEFTPEEARIERNQIVIYKTLRRED